MKNSNLNNGAALMLVASLAFIGYAVVFFSVTLREAGLSLA